MTIGYWVVRCMYSSTLQTQMSFHMQRQMIRSTERALAQLARKRPVPRVLALMAGQLIRARKPPPAPLPPAQVGLLARVGARVRLQMRGLGVGLAAAAERARVNDRLASGNQEAAATALFQCCRRRCR